MDTSSDANPSLRAGEIARDVLVAWLANGGKVDAAGLPGLLADLTASARASLVVESGPAQMGRVSVEDAGARDAPEGTSPAPSALRVQSGGTSEPQGESAPPTPAAPVVLSDPPGPPAEPTVAVETDAQGAALRWNRGPFGDIPALPLKAWDTGDYRIDHIKEDCIYCLECGKHFRSLKRHLNEGRKAHGGVTISEDEYRRKWGLPSEKELTLGAREYVRKKEMEGAAVGLGTKTNKALRALLDAFAATVVPALAALPRDFADALTAHFQGREGFHRGTTTIPDANAVTALAREVRADMASYADLFGLLEPLSNRHGFELAQAVAEAALTTEERATYEPTFDAAFAAADFDNAERAALVADGGEGAPPPEGQGTAKAPAGRKASAKAAPTGQGGKGKAADGIIGGRKAGGSRRTRG